MKEQNHISNGDLELYLLDVLSDKERLEVEHSLHTKEIKEESNTVEETLELLAKKDSRKPSAKLRSRVLSDISQVRHTTESTNTRYLMAASISLAIVASAVAFMFWNNWQSAENQLQLALQENTYMADQATFTNQKIEQLLGANEILSNPDFKQIRLKGLEGYSDYLTSVYWNNQTKETFLKINNLGKLNSDQQYQLWSIQDGKPVDSGIFDMSDVQQLIKMKSNEFPQAFAITIEPRGGSKSPTLENMVVIGNVEV